MPQTPMVRPLFSTYLSAPERVPLIHWPGAWHIPEHPLLRAESQNNVKHTVASHFSTHISSHPCGPPWPNQPAWLPGISATMDSGGSDRNSSVGSSDRPPSSDGFASVPSRATSSSASVYSRSYGRSSNTSLFKSSHGMKKGKGKGGFRSKAPRALISPAERDLRLLSAKAAEAFHQTKFDQWLARKHLVFPYLLTIMCLCYTTPVVILYLEETDENFAEYGRWVWRITIFLTFGLTIPMWIAMMQWRPAVPLNGDVQPGEHLPTVDVAIACYKEDVMVRFSRTHCNPFRPKKKKCRSLTLF